jgi:hypothetical protein
VFRYYPKETNDWKRHEFKIKINDRKKQDNEGGEEYPKISLFSLFY